MLPSSPPHVSPSIVISEAPDIAGVDTTCEAELKENYRLADNATVGNLRVSYVVTNGIY